MILNPGYQYKRNPIKYQVRDLALMSVLYLGTARVTEVLGGPVLIQGETKYLPGVTRDQFIDDDDQIWLRQLPIIKQKFVKRGSRWIPIMEPRDYPKRVDIPFFKNEDPFNKFTSALIDHLDTIPNKAPVFKIKRSWAYQVIKQKDPEWFPHYFRDQGLKCWYRYFKRDAFKLKKYSGHKRWNSLEKYVTEELFYNVKK